jgi:hypothetical protein
MGLPEIDSGGDKGVSLIYTCPFKIRGHVDSQISFNNARRYLSGGYSDAGGERAASLYSLLGSARLNEINPETYLRHVLTVIADHPVNRVAELLPWNLQLDAN